MEFFSVLGHNTPAVALHDASNTLAGDVLSRIAHKTAFKITNRDGVWRLAADHAAEDGAWRDAGFVFTDSPASADDVRAWLASL